MHVARLIALHVRIPLRQTIRHASHTRDSTDSLLVRCELDDGKIGWGEGLPREYVSGETIDDVWAALSTLDIYESLGRPFSDLNQVIECLDCLTLCPSEISDLRFEIEEPRRSVVEEHIQRGCFLNSARCAIELAVLDAVCQREGRPLLEVTSLVPETVNLRQFSPTVQYSGVIASSSLMQQFHSAIKMRLYGFRQVKVKVGLQKGDEATRLHWIRRILGRKISMRVDANEAWSCDDFDYGSPHRLCSDVSCVEQPVPHADAGGLADVREGLTVPIMLDESLCSLSDGQRAIDEKLCDLFNIRLSKCGGFVSSLRLAAMAHSAGLGYQLGCQVGETGILSAAGRHFATSVAGLFALEGSYDRHLVAERLTHEDLTFGYGGVAPALKGPGLGVTVDQEALDRSSVRCQTIWER